MHLEQQLIWLSATELLVVSRITTEL